MGFDVTEFWAGTQASFAAAVRGRITARREARELAMYGAWQSERFRREDRLKPFSQYTRQIARAEKEAVVKPDAKASGGAMLASLLAIQQAGVPMSIKRLR